MPTTLCLAPGTSAIQLQTGQTYEIAVEKGEDAVVCLLFGDTPPWQGVANPQGRLLDEDGQPVATAPLKVSGRQAELRFSGLQQDQTYALEIDGVEEAGKLLRAVPLEPPAPPPAAPTGAAPGAPSAPADSAPAASAAPASPAQPTLPLEHDTPLHYHDLRHDRQELAGAKKPAILAHCAKLGGFYLLDGVGEGKPNRPDMEDVRKVQERLWACGFLPLEEVGKPAGPATFQAIRAFQKAMRVKPDGQITPEAFTHRSLMGATTYGPIFCFAPEQPAQPEMVLEPNQNPAGSAPGVPLKNILGQDVVVIAPDSGLATMVHAFDPEPGSRRHYDHINGLDGLTIGVAHWPLKEACWVFQGIWSQLGSREAFLWRLLEFFEVPENGPLWEMAKADAATHRKELSYPGLNPRVTYDLELSEVRELAEATFIQPTFFERYFPYTSAKKHRGQRIFDLLWFRKCLQWVFRDRRIVETQVRLWIKEVIHPAQKVGIERFGLRTVGGLASLISIENSRPAWKNGLPSGPGWQGKAFKKGRFRCSQENGQLVISGTTGKGKRAEVRWNWNAEPRQEMRSYIVWQFYWAMKCFFDGKTEVRDRMEKLWELCFAKAFGAMPDHALATKSRAQGTLDAGTILPEDFDPENHRSYASMIPIVPSYASEED